MAVSGIISQEQIQQLVDSDLVNNKKTLEMIDAQREREIQAKTELEEIRTATSDLESALETLKASETFYSSAVSTSDSSIVTAEAGANTSLTSYDITNITMAKAAQKVSSSTLGLEDATSAYYESTASILDNSQMGYSDDMSSIDAWTDNDYLDSNAFSTQETFDGKETFKFEVPLTGSGRHAQRDINVGTGKIADVYNADISLFLDVQDTFASGNRFNIDITKDSHQLSLSLATDGMYAYDGTSWNKVAADAGGDVAVDLGSWTNWSFEVDASTPGFETMTVYKDGVAVASGVDVSATSSNTDGDVTLTQWGGANGLSSRSYVDSFEISPVDTSGLVEENVLLDGSEGPANIAGAISSGYFDINNQRISVDPSKDTLMEILSKINAAETGVTATWDNDNDKIRLTVDEGGEQTIEFGADTSGFLAAMNIDTSAPTATGVESAWDRELDQVVALSAVSSGYFNINGITFDVDTSVDSLQDILNDINQSKAGVSVYYEKSLDKVVMTSTETGQNITFGNDTSNFLTTVMGNLDEAAYTQGSADVNGQTIAIDSNEFEIGDVKFKVHSESVEGATVTIARDTEKATLAIEDFVTKYNDLRTMIDEKSLGGQPLSNDRLLRNIENNLRHFVLNPITNTGSYDFLRDVGIEYKRGRLSVNSSTLEDAFRNDPDSVGTLFGYDADGDGIRNDGGLSNRMIYDFLSSVTSKYSGDIGRKNKLMDFRIDKLNNDYKKYQKVIADKTDRLFAEYTRFADAVNQMSAQFSAFQAQMAQLNQLTSSLYSNIGSSSSSSF